MKQNTWQLLGRIAYWVLWPAIYAYSAITPHRARVIINCGEDILLVKNWLGSNGWAIPGGGLERGEDASAAAVREISEELAISVSPNELIYIGNYTFRGLLGMPSKYVLFSIELAERPDVQAKQDEIMGYAWINYRKIHQEKVHRSATKAIRVWMDHQKLL